MQKGFAWNLQNLCLCVSKCPPALCGFLCIQTTGSPKAAEYRDLFLVHMSLLNLAKDPCLLFEYEIPYHIKTEQFLLLDYIYIFLIKGHWTANSRLPHPRLQWVTGHPHPHSHKFSLSLAETQLYVHVKNIYVQPHKRLTGNSIFASLWEQHSKNHSFAVVKWFCI